MLTGECQAGVLADDIDQIPHPEDALQTEITVIMQLCSLGHCQLTTHHVAPTLISGTFIHALYTL